jgi:hypothetical protein
LVEPLLHFVVPFASLKAVGIDIRKAVFASLVALTPDLDILFRVHRSQTHSLIILTAITLPLLVATRNRKNLRTLIIIGAFGVLVHIALDLFQTSTPLFWPLFDQSIWISTTLDLQIGSAPAVESSMQLLMQKTAIEPFVSFDAPILTGPGLGISFALLAPTLIQLLRKRR